MIVPASAVAPRVPDFLRDGGEMGALIRAMDWSSTPLGDVATWPASLVTAVSICLDSRFPILLWWGRELVMIYNDAYRPILGDKHPRAMGQAGRECWPEIWPIIGPMLEGVLERGEATWSENQMLALWRHGFAEECYFTFSYSPIRDESGVAGVFCAVTETTGQVLSERRLRTLRHLGECVAAGRSEADVWRGFEAPLAANAQDLPFCLLYRIENEGHARLAAHVGNPSVADGAPATVTLADGIPERWPHPTPLRTACVPVARGAGTPYGFLVVGLNPMRHEDGPYRDFLRLVADHIADGVGNARAYDEERRRAEALAELDRAKTAFFSNVSHEFRTPLTLMLGPIQQMTERHDLRDEVRASLAVVQRNALRLQRMVNALLEFSRIEAGRVRAAYEPVDLAALTADLASTFRSTMENGGLAYEVSCAGLDEPAYVDREMWEKVVLNLLSNAFKFTLEGRVTVTLAREGATAVLAVEDTGIGIAEAELPRLFDRFHRVEAAGGRTYEGSGIGLALVNELVKMHGGTVTVASVRGRGSRFTVRIPLGRAHLPVEAIRGPSGTSSIGQSAHAYAEEARRWLPDAADGTSLTLQETNTAAVDPRFAATFGARIVVADDNADMRAYLRGLLAASYAVECVADGEAALAAARRARPALVISDVMMPRLDGFGLIRGLRDDRALDRVPVLVLSARAGEEARIEGLDAGADDYIVKPFSARELLARVGALIERDVVRRASEERLRRAFMQAPGFMAILEGPEHRFTFANEGVTRVFGRRSTVGRTVVEAFPELERQGIVAILDGVYGSGQRFIAREMPLAFEATQDKPAQRLFLDFVYEPLRDESGTVIGIVVNGVDVTEAREAREALQTASRQKDEFLAMLAHELRNPLAPIRNASELLARLGIADPRANAAVGMIRRQADQLTRIVDDLLDVSRITQGRIALKRAPVDLGRIVLEAVEAAESLIRERRHTLTVARAHRRLTVDGDAARLTQCVVNLLTNAAKYTDPGGTIRVAVTERDGWSAIEVSDDGMGIAPDLLPRVFDLFVQDERALDRSQGGLGIGLSLVKHLIGMHGGTVAARSDGPGCGATFSIRLPVVASASDGRHERDAPSAGASRILVVDDNVDAAESLAALLRLHGHDARTVHVAGRAIDEALAFAPDVILLDIGLPDIDGYALARLLRARPELAGARLIAVTGYGRAEDRRCAEAAGFDAHLLKPVAYDVLDRMLGGTVESAASLGTRH